MVLGEEAIEWVENTIVDQQLLVRLAGQQIRESLDLGSSGIQSSGSLDHRRRLWGDFEEEQRWGTSGPGIAENWLILAIKIAQVRSSGMERPQSCGLVESSFNLAALAEASLVPPGDQNPPFLGGIALRLDA